MTKLTLISVITASLLLIGCGENKPTTETKSESIKTEAKASATNAETMAKKETETAKEIASTTATKTVETTKEAKGTTPTPYLKCVTCHGKDGKLKALGKSELLAGQSKDDLIKKIKEYKAGSRNVTGMGSLMKGQVAGLNDSDIKVIATYLSELK